MSSEDKEQSERWALQIKMRGLEGWSNHAIRGSRKECREVREKLGHMFDNAQATRIVKLD